jgi:hypothetical protein
MLNTTENIFFAWVLFNGSVALIVATLILLFNWTKRSRLQ